jgi:hypothetical protein
MNAKNCSAKARTSRQVTNLRETKFFPSGTAGTLHGGDWGRTYTAGVPEKTIQAIKSAADDVQRGKLHCPGFWRTDGASW